MSDTETDDSSEDPDKLNRLQRKVLTDLRAMRGSGPVARQELVTRVKAPGKAQKADYANSRAHAIDQHCVSCQGGSKKDVRECRSYSCHFWTFRPNADTTVRPPGFVPTQLHYSQLLDAKTTEAQRGAAAKRLRGDGDEAPEDSDE